MPSTLPENLLLSVKRSPTHGRGVFARFPLRRGELLERSPVLLMNEASGLIETYVFDWGNGQVGVALGLVSLLNHSREPNCEVYTVGTKKDAWLELHTTRAVEAGEELFIDYGLDHPTGAL